MDYDLVHGVERHFLSLEELAPNEKEFNIMLKVGNGISWALKFRHSGLIYNRLDLVLTDCISCDGTVALRDFTSFHNLIIGETTFEEEIKHERMKIQASADIIHTFKARFTEISNHSHRQHPAAPSSSSGSSSSSATHNSNHHNTTAHNIVHNNNSNTGNTSNSMRDHRVLSANETPPLKTGWLLKKRDIISGWKCRYFEIYHDRLDYYASQEDARPRGSYPLFGVEVLAVRPLKMKRKFEHYGFFLQLRCPDKTIKLASEHTGLEGKVEADAWYQVFTMIAETRGRGASFSASPLPPIANNKFNNNTTASNTPVNSTSNKKKSGTSSSTKSKKSPGSSKKTNAPKTIGDKFARFLRRLTNTNQPKATNTKSKQSKKNNNKSTTNSNNNINNKNNNATNTVHHSGGTAKQDGKKRRPSVTNDAKTSKVQQKRKKKSGYTSYKSETVSGPFQILLYGGGIIVLSIALFYAWYVTHSLSTKSFVILSILMMVLLGIFVQEFILDDEEDEEEEEEDEEEEGGEEEDEHDVEDEEGGGEDGDHEEGGGDEQEGDYSDVGAKHESFDHGTGTTEGEEDEHHHSYVPTSSTHHTNNNSNNGSNSVNSIFKTTHSAVEQDAGEGEREEEEEEYEEDEEDDENNHHNSNNVDDESDEEAHAAAAARLFRMQASPPPVQQQHHR